MTGHRPHIDNLQVEFWPTQEFLDAQLAAVNINPTTLPWAGTPAWQQLDDGDPRKLLALANVGVHYSLKLETDQLARADASKAIAGAIDWPAYAQQRLQRATCGAYVPRTAVAR